MPTTSVHVSPILVSVSDAGKLLGVGRSTVYKLIAQGDLDRVKLLNRALITRASIDATARKSDIGGAV